MRTRKVFSLALKDDRVEQRLRSFRLGVNSKCGVQSKRMCESHESCVLYVNCFGKTLLYMCIEYHI